MGDDEDGPDLSIFSFAADDDEIEAGMKKVAVSEPSKEGKKGQGKGQGKQAKRKQKKEEEEREREQRIAEHHAGKGPSERDIEVDKIAAQLVGEGMRILEIAADGNCLYRAIAQQLGKGSDAFASCRREAAQHIRSHPSDFLPYIQADGGELGSYCDTVETSDEWGGTFALPLLTHIALPHAALARDTRTCHATDCIQHLTGQLEITALAHARKRCISVYRCVCHATQSCCKLVVVTPFPPHSSRRASEALS